MKNKKINTTHKRTYAILFIYFLNLSKKKDMEVGLAQQRKKEKERRTRKGPMVHMSKEEGEKKKVRCEGTISCKLSLVVIL
jgi:hypothetical protein